jgi:hypothetical protein
VARFVPARDLDARVARVVLQPAVSRIKNAIEREAKVRAPASRVWISAGDDRVRPSHVLANGQEIPSNLNFVLQRMQGTSRNPVLSTGIEEARQPRDPALSAINREGCRCTDVTLPGEIALHIHAGPTLVAGTVVRAEVSCDYPHRVKEAELEGRFMSGAAQQVARGSRTRTTPGQ